jgi:hypothetical protein
MINKDRIKAAVLSNKVKVISGLLGSIVLIVVIILIALIIKPKDNSTEISSENNRKDNVALETTTKKNKENSEEETTPLVSEDTKATEIISAQKQTTTVTSITVASTVKSTTSATVNPTTIAPTTVTPPTTVASTTVPQTTEVPTDKTYYYNGREVSELEYKIQTNPLNENVPAGSTLTWGTNEWGFSYNLIMPAFNVNEAFFDINYVVMENYKGTTVIDAFYYWFIIYSDNSYEVKLKPEHPHNTNYK